MVEAVQFETPQKTVSVADDVPSRPLRVAYVVHTFDCGGLERCVAHFVNHLDRTQFQPIVVCLNRSGGAADWIDVDDVPIIELHKRDGNDWQLVGRLANALRAHSVDLVQSHNWGTLVETALACRRTGTRHVHAEHGQQLHALQNRGLKLHLHGIVRRWAFRRIDTLVAVAETVRRSIAERWKYSAERVQVLANGVEAPLGNVAAARMLRHRLGISDESPILGSVGRLAPVKDFGTAIHATARLVSEGRDVHLVLVGDGPESEVLKSHARAAGIEARVHLVGRQTNVGDWLRMFDVYVNSSVSEAMSMSILEAMAVGLPIIATDVGDTPRLIDGPDPAGTVVPTGDPAAWADAVAMLLNDKGEQERYGEAGRRRFETTYTVEQMVARYAELYLRVGTRRQLASEADITAHSK